MNVAKPYVWTRLQPRGGTQVPKEIRDALDLKPGDVILWNDMLLGKVMVTKGKMEEVTREWPHKTSQ